MKNLPAKIVGTVLAKKEGSAAAVEDGIMVALIAAVIITIVATLGSNLNTMFENVSSQI